MKFSFAAMMVLVFFVFLPMPTAAKPAGNTYVESINYRLEQPFGGISSVSNIAEYIQTIYKFALGIVGIVAVILIMAGGLRWVAAAGNDGAIEEAKKMIVSAVTGLTIALLSYVILLTISPQLVRLHFAAPKITIPKGSYLWRLQWCDSSNYVGKQCSSDSGTANCEQLACGEVGTAENAGGLCRGAICTGDVSGASRGCYRDSNNPTDEAACTMKDCGSIISTCSGIFPEDKALYSKCVCNYYGDLVKTQLNYSQDFSQWTPEQGGVLKELCSEATDQASWVQKITASPGAYGYTAAPSYLLNVAWNCSFAQCKFQEGSAKEYTMIDVSGGKTKAESTTVIEYKCVAN